MKTRHRSLCPTIYGHEMVKAGLVLGLFGGSQKFVDSKDNIPIRGDPHILVVGDPGLGKSQMLQAAANITPRGVYVCGNTTTTSGLTVTLTKEGGGSGNYALEAGALVLADQVCNCIKSASADEGLIRCEMEGQSLCNNQILSIGEKNHSSIINCSAPRDMYSSFDPDPRLPSRSFYVGIEDDSYFHFLSIRLEEFINDTDIHLHGSVDHNTNATFTLRLRFIGDIMHPTPFGINRLSDPLVCYHQSNTFTNGTDENITVMKPTYVLCRVVRANFLTLVPDDYYKLNAAPGTVLTSYNHSSTYWDLLILLPCHCTNTTETMEIIGIPRDQNNHVQPIKFRVMWDCSSCQEGPEPSTTTDHDDTNSSTEAITTTLSSSTPAIMISPSFREVHQAVAIGASMAIFVLIIVVVVATALPIGVAVIICRNKKNKQDETHVQQPDEARDVQHSDKTQPSNETQYPNNTEADTSTTVFIEIEQ